MNKFLTYLFLLNLPLSWGSQGFTGFSSSQVGGLLSDCLGKDGFRVIGQDTCWGPESLCLWSVCHMCPLHRAVDVSCLSHHNDRSLGLMVHLLMVPFWKQQICPGILSAVWDGVWLEQENLVLRVLPAGVIRGHRWPRMVTALALRVSGWASWSLCYQINTNPGIFTFGQLIGWTGRDGDSDSDGFD